jgi:hypothetical protein
MSPRQLVGALVYLGHVVGKRERDDSADRQVMRQSLALGSGIDDDDLIE